MSNRQKDGEFSPTSSRPECTAERSFKAPTLLSVSKLQDSKGAIHLKPMERNKPLPIEELEEVCGDV